MINILRRSAGSRVLTSVAIAVDIFSNWNATSSSGEHFLVSQEQVVAPEDTNVLQLLDARVSHHYSPLTTPYSLLSGDFKHLALLQV